VSTAEGVEVLYELAKRADVFLANFLPGTRQRFKIAVDDIRAVNPSIIYVRGSVLGPRGAENIAPAEIEDVLLAHPGITEAAVLGLPDPERGQRLVAVGVGEGDPKEIRQWVKDRLRSSKTPETIVFRGELPKTETGKLLRRVLLSELEQRAPA
jgi:non-ribosomal peptide synthetase component E (peptide arylation enzyme)